MHIGLGVCLYFAAFEQEGKHHLMESLGCVDGDVVDAVLHGEVLQVGLLTFHFPTVGVSDFGGVELEGAPRFEVDETMGAVVECELQFALAVEGVEEDYFVAVVTQVAQGVNEVLMFVVGEEGVGEDNDEGAAVELFGDEVEGGSDVGGVECWRVGGLEGLEELVEEAEEVALVGGVGSAGGLEVDTVREKGESEGVALSMEDFDEDGGGVGGEGDFVGITWATGVEPRCPIGVDIAVSFEGEEHGGGLVDEDLTAEVGFFLVLLDEESVGASIEAPVDVCGGFAGVVVAIVGEFDGKAVQGAAMAARNETLDHLPGKEVEGLVAGDLLF